MGSPIPLSVEYLALESLRLEAKLVFESLQQEVLLVLEFPQQVISAFQFILFHLNATILVLILAQQFSILKVLYDWKEVEQTKDDH